HPRPSLFPYTTLFRSPLDAILKKQQALNQKMLPRPAPAARRTANRGRDGILSGGPLALEPVPWVGDTTFANPTPSNASRHVVFRSEEHTSELQSRVDL